MDDDLQKRLRDLAEPFPRDDIEWRVQQAGKSNQGKLWARVLAYVTNRAIMQRLDDVVGPDRWRNDFKAGPTGGILCGIGIYVSAEIGWVWKWDGAENTDIEAIKGGLSGSMKRAAVQWGIGRYLYDLKAGYANIHDNGEHFARLPQKEGGDAFKWDPPSLPAWALPHPKEQSRQPPPPSNSAPETNGESGLPQRTRAAFKAPTDPEAATIEQLALIDKMMQSHVFTEADREAAAKYLGGAPKKARASKLIESVKSQLEERKAAEQQEREAHGEEPKKKRAPAKKKGGDE